MIYSKNFTHSRIKKQVIAQKCITLLRTNKYVLFFHYNANGRSPFSFTGLSAPSTKGTGKGNAQAQGSRSMGCNWQLFKEQIQCLHSCKSLVLPSKIAGYGRSQSFHKEKDQNLPEGNPLFRLGIPSLIRGGVLLVACSSPSQMAALLEKCSSPTFFCIGGTYEMRPMSHLDIQRWVSLESKEGTSCSALSKMLGVLIHWQKTFPPLSLNLRSFVDLQRSTKLVTQNLLDLLVSPRLVSLSPKGKESTPEKKA